MEAILLDLGGVVYEIDWLTTNRLLKIPKTVEWWTTKAYDAYERGHLTTLQFQKEFEKDIGKTFEHAQFVHAIQQMIVRPLPHIEKILARVRVPLFALSNTNQAHWDHFIHDRAMQYFQKVFTSFELGLRKPELEIYRKTAAAMGIEPPKILFIDDREDNLKSASDLGFKTYQCLNEPQKMQNIFKDYGLIEAD